MGVISEYGAVSMQCFDRLSHMRIDDFVIYLESESKIAVSSLRMNCAGKYRC